jgi:hypothetical protein
MRLKVEEMRPGRGSRKEPWYKQFITSPLLLVSFFLLWLPDIVQDDK